MTDPASTQTVVWTDERIRDFAGWSLIRASLGLVPRLAQALAPTGLTPTQFGVLVQLDNTPGITQAALARRCMMTPQSLGELLPALVTSGYVARGERSGRGHPIPVSLTPAGRRVLSEATPLAEAVSTPEALGLAPAERRRLNELLLAVADGEE